MAEGYFISHVYTSNGAIPIVGATVVITQQQADGVVLLGVRRTNISGLTERLTIDTPEASASQTPDNGRPYSLVDITVDHPDYGEITANNVQIFPAITTDQDFMLIPSGLLPGLPDESQQYNTPAQDL